jgi:type VI protein secretion system component VasA
MRPTLDNVKLYCTPIANLFKHDALPIRLDGKQDEYLLLPAELDRKLRVFSVDGVTGWSPAASVIRLRAVRIVRARRQLRRAQQPSALQHPPAFLTAA